MSTAPSEDLQAESADAPVVPSGPRIEVLGDASPEQVEALVAILSGLGGGEEEQPAGPPSRWNDRARLVRSAVHPSRGGWRASGLPR